MEEKKKKNWKTYTKYGAIGLFLIFVILCIFTSFQSEYIGKEVIDSYTGVKYTGYYFDVTNDSGNYVWFTTNEGVDIFYHYNTIVKFYYKDKITTYAFLNNDTKCQVGWLSEENGVLLDYDSYTLDEECLVPYDSNVLKWQKQGDETLTFTL